MRIRLADGGILVDDRHVEVEEVAEDFVVATLDQLGELADIKAGEIGDGLELLIHSSDGFGTYLFHELRIAKLPNRPSSFEFTIHHPNKYWDGRYGLATLLDAMREQTKHHDALEVSDIDLDDDWKRLVVSAAPNPDSALVDEVARIANELIDLHKNAVVSLSGFVWKTDYDTNERLFCTEVLAPLLRRMDFVAVHYTQGAREYGKDFTFSESTKFGHLRHFGLQAKCGNVRGNVNGDIDELIGQLDDAFKMPYVDETAGDERRISTFVMAISGRFTENAKQKIAHKIPNELRGSVVFLDRDRILELVDRYWVR